MESINEVSPIEAGVSRETTPGGVMEILSHAFAVGEHANEFDVNGRKFNVTDASTALYAAVQARKGALADALAAHRAQTA